ncbi:formimidoylglutamate deiminase [Pukyongiella litopenaei]|uniref:Formimidoylglutamate deiminase n=1 Tax=Pukyongiella litopenaei TaxID=2605946 RepID=A0A2S0MM34_9RHOB|nr:formimidoylglutamate deiminase [Pukyongiella litopenaei]AVO36743.1 formimidoylglutamate deiminase [Pukyongiella litopenaei]
MTVLYAKQALLPEGWARDVTVTIGADGRIAGLDPARADIGVDMLLPAPANVHSHAFQRAMAGLTERRGGSGQDSFWTWRKWMYRFLDQLTPDDAQSIAALVQMEMLEAGFATVGEFHYLHHRPDGGAYDDPAEMAARICAAAETTGIGLTLLPVFYEQGGVDGRALGPGQRRFGCDRDGFAALMAGAGRALDRLPGDAVIGVAPHSLRAVTPAALSELVAGAGGPVHMHIAEQVAEVEEIEAAHGARPVTWLLDNCPPDPRWCLIHCTQMTAAETGALAATGAVAGLCPITEANLGDGIFDGAGWLGADGAISVGSDSNIRISLTGELRLLEYSQRLRDRARAVLAPPGGSTGRRLFDGIVAGGARAAGRGRGGIAVGQWADLLAIDGGDADLIGRGGDAALDTWIFAAGDRLVRDVWAAGRHMVRDGRHLHRDRIRADYAACMARLAQVL